MDGSLIMANVIKTVQDLIPGKEYIIRIRAKNTDLNTYSNATDSIRFTVPQDQTIPGQVQNLSLYSSFQTVMFVYDFNSENDISHYEYELYYGTLTAGEPTGELHSQGKATANVFTVTVENSTTDTATGVSDPVTYCGRMRAVDLTGNIGEWSTFAQSDQDTPLIDEEFIASLTAAKITAGTIGAHEIILTQSGTVTTYDPPGNVAVLRSSNFASGPAGAGWLIRGDGYAEFDSTHIRGNLDAGSITVGNGTYNYWNKTGAENDFRVGDSSTYVLWDNSAGTLTVAGDASISGTLNSVDGTFSGTLSAVDGTFSGTLSGVGGTFTSNVTVGSHATNKITIASDSTASGTKIYAGTGTYSNSNTGFYFDASGRFSIGDKLVFNPSNGALSLNGNPNGLTSDIEIIGAIIKTVEDTDTEDGVALTENDIYLYNRTSNQSQIKFQGSTAYPASIISEIKGLQLSATTSAGSPKFVIGTDSTSENYLSYKWYGYNSAAIARLYQTSSSAATIFDLYENDSEIRVGELALRSDGASNNPAVRFNSDGTTANGLYRWSNSSQLGIAHTSTDGTNFVSSHDGTNGVFIFNDPPITTSVSGYGFLLHNNTYGTLHKYTSSRNLKENIENITDTGTFFDDVRPVTFVPKSSDPDNESEENRSLRLSDVQHGFIAEEISEILGGQLATYDQDLNATGWRWPDMIAMCVAEIKSLRTRVAQLESS